jgi:diguanylate cyclase (GGDEF)-like protein
MNANVRGEIRSYQDQNQDLKSVTAMLGVEEKGDFWFTNCMGGAALMEYDGQTVEVFRLNDALYDMIGLPRKVTDNYRTHATDLVGPKLRPAIHQMMDEAAEKGDAECELEIKLRSELRWIRCSFRRLSASGQNVIIFVLLEDVTRKRLMELNRADQWQQHMCRILAEMPSLAVFEYDPQNDRMHFFRGMARRMGDEQITERYLENLEQQTRLTPASAKLIQAAFLAALQGPIMDSVDFQADYYGTGFHWFRIRYHSISDEGGNIIRIVGQLDNAEKEIKREQVLREQARRDAMTGLLNHDTLELEISKAIGECDGGTLLVVDLDNFKRVNDRLGHHYGDLLLQRVSDVIRSLFREGDLVGRFGGDEFVAFMPGVKSDHLPGQRAGEIVQSINTIELPELGHAGCSVGVAVAKNKTVSWQELFRRADYALYEAKRAGKGGYVLYEGERSVYRMPEVGPRTDLPSGILEARPRMLAGDVFDILYHNGGSEAAIQAALGYVGRWIEVSRSYIFETDPDGVRCTNTFEWCKEGIPPEKDNLQHILLAENGTSLYDNFDKDDIFYCPDVRDLPDWQRELVEAQGIGAMLWKALRWNGEIRGFVGFDINGETCGWVKEQVESMRRIAAVIGVFLRLLRDSQGTFS